MATPVWVRQYLRDQGYRDEDITWDPESRAVRVQGRTFMYGTPQADSRIYATQDELRDALRQFRQQGLQSRTEQTLGRIENIVNQEPFQFRAPQPFQYDPQSDPAYQAALREAQRNAQSAANQAMATLAKRGLGNSSITDSAVARAQQSAFARVSDTVLPALIQQAYQRYADQANRDLQLQQIQYGTLQDRIANLARVLGLQSDLYQQDFQNELAEAGLTGRFRGENTLERRLANLAAARQVGQDRGLILQPMDDWSFLFTQTGLGPNVQEQQRQFENELARQQAALAEREFGLRARQTEAQLANMAADNARQAARLAMEQEEFRNNREARNFLGRLMDDLGELDNEQDIRDFLRLNAGEISSILGVDTYNRILQSALAPFEQQRAAQGDVYQQAVRLAQSDPNWPTLDAAGRQALIDQYIRMLSGGS